MKKKYLVNLIELKQFHDLCDIWRIRNPIATRLTFLQKHCTGFTQCRFDFIFISNGLEEFVSITNNLTDLYTDHSPVHISLSKENNTTKGNNLGIKKFFKDDMHVSEVKKMINMLLMIL